MKLPPYDIFPSITSDRISLRQVQTSDRTGHWDREAPLGMFLENPQRHALSLTPKYQTAIRAIGSVQIALRRLRREIETAAPINSVTEGKPVGVHPQIHVVPVIEAGPPHLAGPALADRLRAQAPGAGQAVPARQGARSAGPRLRRDR